MAVFTAHSFARDSGGCPLSPGEFQGEKQCCVEPIKRQPFPNGKPPPPYLFDPRLSMAYSNQSFHKCPKRSGDFSGDITVGQCQENGAVIQWRD